MTDVTITTVHTVTVPIYPPRGLEENAYGRPTEQTIVLSTEMAKALYEQLQKIVP